MPSEAYIVISEEDSFLNIQTCELRCSKIRERYSHSVIEQQYLEQIAYSLHQLDEDILPPGFSKKVKKLPINAMSIGKWKFYDINKMPMRTTRHIENWSVGKKFRSKPKCSIGFELNYDSLYFKTHIVFNLDNISIEDTHNKVLLFKEIIDLFYHLVWDRSCISLHQIIVDTHCPTPEDYAKTECDFTNLDKFIDDYPLLIDNDTTLYPIIVKMCTTKNLCAKTVDTFNHIVTKYGLKFDNLPFETLTFDILMQRFRKMEDMYIAHLETCTKQPSVKIHKTLHE